MDLVVFMDQYWRNAANAGFNASIDRDQATAGRRVGSPSAAAGPADGPSVWVEEFGRAQGWDYTVGTLTLLGRHGEAGRGAALARSGSAWRSASTRSRRRPVASWRQSWTWARARRAADYEGKDVRGAVVLGDAGTGRLWQMAVVQRGAIGVVSTALESYIRPGPPDSAGRPRSRRASGTCCSGAACRTTRRGAGSGSRPRRERPRGSERASQQAPRACASRSRPASRRGPSARSWPRSRAP